MDDRLKACEPFLKDGETPAECIMRSRSDTDTALGLLAKALQRAEAAEALLAAGGTREATPPKLFPIQGGPAIPWDVVAACEAQAQTNHDQSIAVLARRGGLSPGEAVDLLLGQRWGTTPEHGEATINRMLGIVSDRQPAAAPDLRALDCVQVIERLDAIAAVNYCTCGRPFSEHVYWEDRIYDYNGYRCPGGLGSDYRHDAALTAAKHKQARADELDAVIGAVPRPTE